MAYSKLLPYLLLLVTLDVIGLHYPVYVYTHCKIVIHISFKKEMLQNKKETKQNKVRQGKITLNQAALSQEDVLWLKKNLFGCVCFVII